MTNRFEEGEASYYDNKSIDPRWGGVTKGGDKFDENLLTAAVSPKRWKELKNKTLRVTNPANGKFVDVKVNDTGGFDKYGRLIDLSKGAFSKIEDTKKGVTKVRIEILDDDYLDKENKAKSYPETMSDEDLDEMEEIEFNRLKKLGR